MVRGGTRITRLSLDFLIPPLSLHPPLKIETYLDEDDGIDATAAADATLSYEGATEAAAMDEGPFIMIGCCC